MQYLPPKCLTLPQIVKNYPKLLGEYRTPAPTRSRRNLPRFADWVHGLFLIEIIPRDDMHPNLWNFSWSL